MIQVTIPDHFIAERTYAVQAVLHHLLGLPVTVTPDAACRDYVIRWGEKTIVVEDGFFGKLTPTQAYLDTAFIPYKAHEAGAMGLHHIVRIFGQDRLTTVPDRIECGVDLFAGAFFMLTRWEETLPHTPDAHGRFPADQALIVRSGFIRRPVVDEYAALLADWLTGFGYPVPTQAYRITPTCDVDHPQYWPEKGIAKRILGRLARHKNPFRITEDIRTWKAVRQGVIPDPYDQFDDMMNSAADRNLRFTFNFIAGGQTKFEGNYSLADTSIRRLIDTIQRRGHDIGLHPSYDAGRQAHVIAAERQALEKAVGHAVTTSRQHYLRFTTPDTWRQLALAGITEDSTMGYAAEPGFRCGTCKPFPVFDVLRREMPGLIERPLLVMDVSLRYYKKLSVPDALALCADIKDQVRKHHGDFVFLWHNSNLSDIEDWAEWREVFMYLLEP